MSSMFPFGLVERFQTDKIMEMRSHLAKMEDCFSAEGFPRRLRRLYFLEIFFYKLRCAGKKVSILGKPESLRLWRSRRTLHRLKFHIPLMSNLYDCVKLSELHQDNALVCFDLHESLLSGIIELHSPNVKYS